MDSSNYSSGCTGHQGMVGSLERIHSPLRGRNVNLVAIGESPASASTLVLLDIEKDCLSLMKGLQLDPEHHVDEMLVAMHGAGLPRKLPACKLHGMTLW